MSKQNPTRPFKGLHRDASPVDQPKGSYTMAWNAVNETSEGDANFLSNENSNSVCTDTLPSGYYTIGSVYLSDNTTAVFSTNNTNSEIGILDSNCGYTSKVNTTALGFKTTHPIDAIFRIRRGCERVVYFTDGLNPIRHFNFDTPTDFQTGGGAWDAELFKLFLDFTQPEFIDFEIKEQGTLRSGTYSFAIQYLDKDLNPTPWSHVTLPIPIFLDSLKYGYKEITGSSNEDVDSLAGQSNTNKSIRINLNTLDANYDYYRFAVLAATSSDQQVTDAYASYEIPTKQTHFEYDGNLTGFTKITPEEVMIAPVQIDTAKHIEQIENRLVLGNTKGKQVNFCEFQKKASLIKSKYVVASGSADKIKPGNSKDPNTYWLQRGYMGDEVYAFGIVYVFGDGSESPAFHIPGRSIKNPADCVACTGISSSATIFSSIEVYYSIIPPSNYNSPLNTIIAITYTDSTGASTTHTETITTKVTSLNQTTFGWNKVVTLSHATTFISAITSVTITNNQASADLFYNANIPNVGVRITKYTVPGGVEQCAAADITSWNPDMAHFYSTSASYSSGALKQWQVYNTAIPISDTEGFMAYWESANATYPAIVNCDGSSYWGVDACGGTLAGEKIRHHKFPDRNLIPHVEFLSEGESKYQSDIFFKISPSEVCGAGDTTMTDIRTIYATHNSITASAVVPTTTVPLTIKIIILSTTYIRTVQVPFQKFLDAWAPGFAPCKNDWTPFDVYIDTFDYFATPAVPSPVHVASLATTGDGAATTSLGIVGPTYPSGTSARPIAITENTDTTTNGVKIDRDAGLNANNLGIKFEGITYPAGHDIVGHYIVRGDRNDSNRTVLSKGITNSLIEYDDGTTKSINAGYLQGSWWNGSAVDTGNRSEEYNYLITPRGLLADDPPQGTFIKQEHTFDNGCTNCTWTYGNKDNIFKESFDSQTHFGAAGGSAVFNFSGEDYAYSVGTRVMRYRGLLSSKPAVKIRPIFKNLILNGLEYDWNFFDSGSDSRLLYNLSQTNKVHIIKILDGLGGVAGMHSGNNRNMPYVSININRDVYPNLESITYYRTHNNVKTGSSTTVFGGDIVIGPLNYGNTMFFDITSSTTLTVFSIIASTVVIATAVVITVFSYGTAFASIIGAIAVCTALTGATVGLVGTAITEAMKHTTGAIAQMMKNDGEFSTKILSTGKACMMYANELLEDIYIESEYNLGLRQDHLAYVPGNFYRSGNVKKYFRDKLFYFDTEASAEKDKWIHRGAPTPEVYHYNLDFSKINKENAYIPLPASWDCCSDCVDSHPNRVHYSQQSFQEENTDNYRVFLANDYKDLQGEKGEITDIFRKSNSLFIHTEESLLLLPQNMQERITGELISFIGTGEYFSIPPRLMIDDDLGSAGTRHKWATAKTPGGIFFIDEATKGIYLLGNQNNLTRISDFGMKAEFRKMLVPYLAEQFYDKSTPTTNFPFINEPSFIDGVGYHVCFDSKHNRVLFTKRDFYLVGNPVINVVTTDSARDAVSTNAIFYYNAVGKYYFGKKTGATSYTVLNTYDTTYFENKSWTISFSLNTNTWISMHSYLPLKYIYMHDVYYSFFKNAAIVPNSIYKHNILGAYQNFYTTDYQHIIEYVSLSSPVMTRIWDEIMLQTVASIYETVTTEYVVKNDKTFNKAVFYNSTQCSGELNLTVKDDVDENYLVNQIVDSAADYIIISRDNRNWKLNEIRDYRKDYTRPIWSKDWNAVSTKYPIDKVLNSATIDFNKIWSDLQLLRDKYLIIRLIFDNLENNVKLTTNYSFERETPSIR